MGNFQVWILQNNLCEHNKHFHRHLANGKQTQFTRIVHEYVNIYSFSFNNKSKKICKCIKVNPLVITVSILVELLDVEYSGIPRGFNFLYNFDLYDWGFNVISQNFSCTKTKIICLVANFYRLHGKYLSTKPLVKVVFVVCHSLYSLKFVDSVGYSMSFVVKNWFKTIHEWFVIDHFGGW